MQLQQPWLPAKFGICNRGALGAGTCRGVFSLCISSASGDRHGDPCMQHHPVKRNNSSMHTRLVQTMCFSKPPRQQGCVCTCQIGSLRWDGGALRAAVHPPALEVPAAHGTPGALEQASSAPLHPAATLTSPSRARSQQMQRLPLLLLRRQSPPWRRQQRRLCLGRWQRVLLLPLC